MPGDKKIPANMIGQRRVEVDMLNNWLSPKNKSVFEPLYKRAIRTTAGLFGVDDPAGSSIESMMPSPMAPAATTVTTIAKKVAPRKAAKELANLLLGRSTRVPSQPIAERGERLLNSLFRQGISGSAAPAPPTHLRMAKGSMFTAPERRLSRNPGLNESFKNWQQVRGQSPNRYQAEVILGNKESLTRTDPEKAIKYRATKMHDNMRGLATRAGSLQQGISGKPIKLKTEQELMALLEGPNRAVQKGFMSPEEAKQVLIANKAKIDEYFSHLKQIDQANYDANMQAKIQQRYNDFTGGK